MRVAPVALAPPGLAAWARRRAAGEPPDAVGELGRLPGVEQVVPFGLRLHVSGRDATQLEASLTAYARTHRASFEPVESSLEDAFIALMRGGERA